jgi:hypothetical protein
MWQLTETKHFPSEIDNNVLTVWVFNEGIRCHYAQRLTPKQPTELVINQVTVQTLAKLNKIADVMDYDKEMIKVAQIDWIKLNPTCTFDEFLAHVDADHGWQNRALFERLVYDYSNNAESLGIIQPPEDPTRENKFVALRDLIVAAPTEVLLSYMK